VVPLWCSYPPLLVTMDTHSVVRVCSWPAQCVGWPRGMRSAPSVAASKARGSEHRKILAFGRAGSIAAPAGGTAASALLLLCEWSGGGGVAAAAVDAPFLSAADVLGLGCTRGSRGACDADGGVACGEPSGSCAGVAGSYDESSAGGSGAVALLSPARVLLLVDGGCFMLPRPGACAAAKPAELPEWCFAVWPECGLAPTLPGLACFAGPSLIFAWGTDGSLRAWDAAAMRPVGAAVVPAWAACVSSQPESWHVRGAAGQASCVLLRATCAAGDSECAQLEYAVAELAAPADDSGDAARLVVSALVRRPLPPPPASCPPTALLWAEAASSSELHCLLGHGGTGRWWRLRLGSGQWEPLLVPADASPSTL
jgi:hypothetical protein